MVVGKAAGRLGVTTCEIDWVMTQEGNDTNLRRWTPWDDSTKLWIKTGKYVSLDEMFFQVIEQALFGDLEQIPLLLKLMRERQGFPINSL